MWSNGQLQYSSTKWYCEWIKKIALQHFCHISNFSWKTTEMQVVYGCTQVETESTAANIRESGKHLLPIWVVYSVNSTCFLGWKSSKRKLHYCTRVCSYMLMFSCSCTERHYMNLKIQAGSIWISTKININNAFLVKLDG